ncbi:MAG: class I SAM-dependent methyltransferase [Alphaproteobacteria bacterium]|nr:MAG: class I SAM-dependent methyltransferase [Alphaproteobacteria bacterium]
MNSFQKELGEAAKKCGVVLPSYDKDQRIETLNNKGCMDPNPDSISLEFIKFCGTARRKINVLEIGPAYGNTAITISADQKFNGTYTVVDTSEDHINIIRERYRAKHPNGRFMEYIVGSFPVCFQGVEPHRRYDAILMAHVLHFYQEDVLDAIQACYKLLKKGGRAYIIAKAPYSIKYQSFIPVFEKRLKDKNCKFPGLVDNMAAFVNLATVSKQKLKTLQGCKFQFFDKDILKKWFENVGFRTIFCQELSLNFVSDMWEAPQGYKGREEVGIIAEKS